MGNRDIPITALKKMREKKAEIFQLSWWILKKKIMSRSNLSKT